MRGEWRNREREKQNARDVINIRGPGEEEARK